MKPGIIVDNFAGGGGASTGIEAALGRAVDVAINHDEEAIRMHEANHPGTLHIRNNVWRVDPAEIAAGRHVQLAWFSPDCKHFSKAKGGKPREKSIRDLAWVVVLWAQRVKPDLILLENVEEFRTWGPLDDDGYPIKERAGETFDQWCKALRKAGYKLQFKELRACDYGAPTIRKRFFMVARCDSRPIVWPSPTHAPADPAERAKWITRMRKAGFKVDVAALQPWRTAAEIIDWSIPCPSIFERKKPLAEKTLRRIAHGVMKFVVNAPNPFIVPLTHHGSADRSYGPDAPLPTVTGANRGEMAVITPYFSHTGAASAATNPSAKPGNSQPSTPDSPPHHSPDAAGAPFFARTAHGDVDRNGKRRGQPCHGPQDSFPTVTQSQDSALIVPHITKFRAGAIGHAIGDPLHTVTANSFVKRPGGSAPLGLVEARLAPVLVGTAFKNTRAARAFHIGEPVRTQTAQAEYAIATAQLAPFVTYAQQGGASRSAEDPVHTITASLKDHNCVVQALLAPVIVGCGGRRGQSAPVGLVQPYPTTTAKADACLVAAHLVHVGNGERAGQAPRAMDAAAPLGTVVAGGIKHHLVTAFMAKYASGNAPSATAEPVQTIERREKHALVAAHLAQFSETREGRRLNPGHDARQPVSTIVQRGPLQAAVTSNLVKLRGTSDAHVEASAEPVDEPLSTISAQGTHMAEVRAFLIKYYGNEQDGHGLANPLGTVTVQDRFGLVTVTIDGEEYVIVDIGMRMLTPRELFNAQGFPPDYIIDRDAQGRPMTKTAQVAKCGNSVSPPLAEALAGANTADDLADAGQVAA